MSQFFVSLEMMDVKLEIVKEMSFISWKRLVAYLSL
jgi:hypothetical protein